MTIILSIVVQPRGTEREGHSRSKLNSLAIKTNADLCFAIPGNHFGINFVLLVDLPSQAVPSSWPIDYSTFGFMLNKEMSGNAHKQTHETKVTNTYKLISFLTLGIIE